MVTFQRTVFVLDIILLQVVLKPGVSPLPWQVNHAAESGSDSPRTWFSPERFQSIAEDITADIATPMFRIQVYQTGVRTYMAFSVNHAIYDGISIGLVMDEVAALYCGLPRKVEPVNLATILNEIPPKEDLSVRSFWTSRLAHIRLDDRPRRRPSRRQAPTRIQRPINVSFSDLAQRCSALHITFQVLSIVAYGIVIRNVFSPDVDSSVFGVR
jgi:ferricrocin synthase